MIGKPGVIIIGDKAFAAKVLKIETGLINFKIPFKWTEIYLESRFARTFEKEGEPKWKEHSAMTKFIRGGSAKVLQDTGRLKATMSGRRGKAGSHRRIGKKRMQYGVSNNYKVAHYMQKGAHPRITNKMRRYMAWKYGVMMPKKDRLDIPARPFMHFVPRDKPKIQKIFHVYLEGLIA